MFQRVVWLTGMPRSGTTWLSQILASHPDIRLKFCPLFSYEFKNQLDDNSSAEAWRALLRKVYETRSDYLDQNYLRRDGNVPHFAERRDQPSILAIKSTRFHHLTPGLIDKCPEIKWIGVARNPCAAIHSWLSNPLEFPAGADPKLEWRTGACRKQGLGEFWGFEDWKAVTGMFLDLNARYPGRFRLIRYETFVSSAVAETRALFDWLGLDLPDQTLDFLQLSQTTHRDHRRAVFKLPSATQTWREALDPEIRAAIEEDLAGSPLAAFLEPAPNLGAQRVAR